jgi:3-deoxy-D-manno-octulosonic-acid transferase
VSATLAEGSSRRSRLAGAFLHDAYASLDAVGAIDDADASRLAELGVNPNSITITGDTRYDQVWQRAQRVDRTSAFLSPLATDRPTIVAGSTWPADERILLPAFVATRTTSGAARLVIAPHEPTSAHLEPIEHWAKEQQLRLDRLGAATASTDVVLVDRVGVLGDLYALADVGFVGGGFHDAGLHSVLEPAAFGAPVLFGPRHDGSRDAFLLVRNGAGRSVTDTASLTDAIVTWISDSAARQATGTRARRVVESGLGAAERSLRVVESLMGLVTSA